LLFLQVYVAGLSAGAVFDYLAAQFANITTQYNPEYVSALVFMTANPEMAQFVRQAAHSQYNTVVITPLATAAAEPLLTEAANHVEMVL
jgi:hypothetical protein